MNNHHDRLNHHKHEHHHPIQSSQPQMNRVFQISIMFNFIFVLIEFYYGFRSHSLSLIGDAGHNLSDVFSLVLVWLGYVLSRSRPTLRFSFGLKKFSILAAFVNSLLLLLTIFYIIYEAFERMQSPQLLDSKVMMIVAALGLVINFSSAMLFHQSHRHDLNLKSAYLHLMADAMISLGVVIAGAFIYFTESKWIDPVVSLVIASLLLVGSWRLLKESIILLFNGVPQQVNYSELYKLIQETVGVIEIQDLKVWAESTSEFRMTAKLKVQNANFKLIDLENKIKHDFLLHHLTIQIES